ncbi:prolyl oligopeptidase family serine peptidase [Streptomyces physcomitrii]|uniref:S9 family peptidase n=1 Tax=Streptomyces physcomitrii TaxID=2724184 RepID=UPI003437700B
MARTRRFSLGVPGDFTLSPDGGTVYFLRSRAGDDPVTCLWSFDCASGRERLLVDPLRLLDGTEEELSAEERVRRERARQTASGIVGFAADRDCALFAFALSGRLWTYRPAGDTVRALDTRGPVLDPRPDPTGTRIAYVAGGALRIIDADGGNERALARPEGPEVVYGLPEHVAAESMMRHRGYWWAPDGQRLLVARVDTSPVRRWYIADPADPSREPVSFPYPAVGTANADVRLWLVDARAGALGPEQPGLGPEAVQVDWNRRKFEYLTAADWDGHGPCATVQSRDQRELRVLAVDPADGTTTPLAALHDSAWVELVPGLPARTTAGKLVTWRDEHSAPETAAAPDAPVASTRRLVVDGEAVTPPGLQLTALRGVEGESVLFTAAYEPTESHLWLYEHGSGLRQLSPEQPGVYDGTRRAGTTVLTSRVPDRPGTLTTIHRDGDVDGEGEQARAGEGQRQGKRQGRGAEQAYAGGGLAPLRTLASHAELPSLEPRMELLTLGPRALRAALFLPSWHRPGDAPLPVLMDPYGGPAMCKVRAEQTWWTYVSQWFAEQGFAVLAVDGRGTPGRGPAWERTIHHDLTTPVLDDQVAALTEAARLRPALDTGRVGIRGWSFGGFLAALAVLRRPDVFHAAVAGAPVTDQRLYDTHWRERHLGHPDQHPEVYVHNSPVHEAGSLTRPLLLVHGLADDNVFAAHTLRLSAALLAAGRPHEVLPLPRATHLPTDTKVAENLLVHQLDFLRRHLGV